MSWRDSQSGSSDWKGGGTNSGVRGGVGGSGGTTGYKGGGGNTGSGNSDSGSRGWGGNTGTNGMGGWGSNLRGRDGLTASQRAQTRDSRLGLKTGTTWHGNTAFGQPGQMAAGYTTMSNQGSGFGMRPTMENYSNYRNLDGSPMFPGAGGSVQAPNAFVGAAMMQQQMRPPAGPQPVGGGIPGDPGTVGIPGTPVIGEPNWPLSKYSLPAFFRPAPFPGIQGGYGAQPFPTNDYPANPRTQVQSQPPGWGGGWPGQGAYNPGYHYNPNSGWQMSGNNVGGKMYYDRVPADPNKMSQSGVIQNNKMRNW